MLRAMIIGFTLAGCAGAPLPDAGAEPVQQVAQGCLDSCGNLKAMGCPSAAITPEGAGCVEVCENMLAAGLPNLTRCMADAASCSAADECGIAAEDRP